MGPNSRAVIQTVTSGDLSNAAFKFGEVKEIVIAGHKVGALRVTYVGELGWELHMPIATTGDVFDALMAAGRAYGVAPVGYRALESLRLEKGYRAWSSDITPNDTPLHAGLGWAVKMKTDQPFLGREAIDKISQMPLTKMLAGFTTEREDIVLSGRETILRNGKFAGYLTSGGYGYTVAKPIGFGYVRDVAGVTEDYLRDGNYQLVVANEIVKCNIHLEAVYDPKNERVKA